LYLFCERSCFLESSLPFSNLNYSRNPTRWGRPGDLPGARAIEAF
jgi:hypothetical protein